MTVAKLSSNGPMKVAIDTPDHLPFWGRHHLLTGHESRLTSAGNHDCSTLRWAI